MSERVIQFGERNRLVGTLVPAAGSAHADVAFIWFNAGVISRIGPHRIFVRLSRRLAEAGFHGLRFDLSGRGDSGAGQGMDSFTSQSQADLRLALDLMTVQTGVRRFVLGGLCAGADNSFFAALAEPRIAGVVLLDPWAYRSRRTVFNSIKARLREPGAFMASLRAIGRGLRARVLRRGARGIDGGESKEPMQLRSIMSRQGFGDGLRAMVDRGVAVYLSYSGGMANDYNYAGQFDDVFGPWGLPGRVQVDYVEHANHTHTELAAQRDLLARVLGWSARFAPLPPAVAAQGTEARQRAAG